MFLLFELLAEHCLFEVGDEWTILLLGSRVQCTANVLQEMRVAELHKLVLVHGIQCCPDVLIVIADNPTKAVVGIPQLHEELSTSEIVLARHENTDRNVMGFVVDAIDEGNLSVVSLHLHVLSIHEQAIAVLVGVAVFECDEIVVGKFCQFVAELPVRCTECLSRA